MKKVTTKFLENNNACSGGFRWWDANCKGLSTEDQLLKLVNYRADWANWLMSRLLNRKDKIRYAVFAAELVINIYEKEHPNNKAPRKAIEAAKEVIKRDTQSNRNNAAYAAYAAAYAAYAADAAADAAAYAAYAADAAADAAAYAAYAAYAADAAADAADAADVKKEIQLKIINYGITLLRGE